MAGSSSTPYVRARSASATRSGSQHLCCRSVPHFLDQCPRLAAHGAFEGSALRLSEHQEVHRVAHLGEKRAQLGLGLLVQQGRGLPRVIEGLDGEGGKG